MTMTTGMHLLCFFLWLPTADALKPKTQPRNVQYGNNIYKLFPNFDPRMNKSSWAQLPHAWVPYIFVIQEHCIEHTNKYSLLQNLIGILVCLFEFLVSKANCQNFNHQNILQILAPTEVPKLAGKCALTRMTAVFASTRIMEPFGQQCLDIVYRLTAALNKNSMNFDRFVNRVTMYHYNASGHFGINITFVTFKLSGWCLISGKIPCNKFNELFLIQNQKHQNLFYCMSRSQWSVYLDNVFTIYFKPCILICHGRVTTITFNSQIMDSNFLRTTQDSYYEVQNAHNNSVVFSTTTIPRKKNKPITVFHTFLTAQRYENIQIVFCHETHIYIYNQENIYCRQKEARRAVLHLNFFHCFFSHLHQLNKSTASVNYTFHHVKHKTFQIDRTRNFTLAASVATPQNRSYHKVTKITADEEQTLVKITFVHFHKSGFYSCFYGAVTFFDGLQLLQTYQICNKHPNNVEVGQTYTAVSNVTYIVVHLATKGSISISFSARISLCQGIFINTCSKRMHPAEFVTTKRLTHAGSGIIYWLHAMFPVESNATNSCAVFHIAAHFLPTNRTAQMHDCLLIFYFSRQTDLEQFGSAEIEYTKYYGNDYRLHTTPRKRWTNQHRVEVFFTMSTPQNNSVTFHSKKQCAEDYFHPKHNNWLRTLDPEGLRITKHLFNFWYQTPISAIKTVFFQTRLLFVHTRTDFPDLLYSVESGLSYDVRILTVKYTAGQVEGQVPQGHSDITNPASGTICLKEFCSKFLYNDMILSLSLQGNLNTCSLGLFNFSVNQCFSPKYFHWYATMPINYEFLDIVKCHPPMENVSKFKTEWSSKLTNTMFLTCNDMIQVALPGKTFNASLEVSNQTCCKSKTCSLSYRWKLPEQNFYNRSCTQRFYIAQFFHDFLQHFKKSICLFCESPLGSKSWDDAYRICNASGHHLPSFVSQSELNEFMDLIIVLGTQIFISTAYLGLTFKVNLLVEHFPPAFNLPTVRHSPETLQTWSENHH